jgi:RHS repeat-associated protein
VNGTAYPYDYNGKENNEELGLNWHDYGSRNYDASLARFMTIDPKTIEFDFQSPYAYAVNNPIFFIDKDGEGPWPLPTGVGIGIAFKRIGRTFKYIANGDSPAKAYAKASADDIKEGTKQVLRYATPVEDVYGVASGKDFDGNNYNRAEAGTWAAASFIPFAKLGKLGKVAIKGFSKVDNLVKYSDEVADLVEATGKVDNGKEIVTALKAGSESLENGIKVADDVIGGLGDDAVEKLGKFGSQDGVKVGYQSANGKKGWRVDYDSKKGGHINWWNGKQKGAIILNAGQNQIDQIIKNGTF